MLPAHLVLFLCPPAFGSFVGDPSVSIGFVLPSVGFLCFSRLLPGLFGPQKKPETTGDNQQKPKAERKRQKTRKTKARGGALKPIEAKGPGSNYFGQVGAAETTNSLWTEGSSTSLQTRTVLLWTALGGCVSPGTTSRPGQEPRTPTLFLGGGSTTS